MANISAVHYDDVTSNKLDMLLAAHSIASASAVDKSDVNTVTWASVSVYVLDVQHIIGMLPWRTGIMWLDDVVKSNLFMKSILKSPLVLNQYHCEMRIHMSRGLLSQTHLRHDTAWWVGLVGARFVADHMRLIHFSRSCEYCVVLSIHAQCSARRGK